MGTKARSAAGGKRQLRRIERLLRTSHALMVAAYVGAELGPSMVRGRPSDLLQQAGEAFDQLLTELNLATDAERREIAALARLRSARERREAGAPIDFVAAKARILARRARAGR